MGQPVPVTFTVTGAPGTPTGNVTVSDGTGATCIGTVAAGTCNLASTTAGAKTLTATYAGDATHSGSTSAGVGHTVSAAAPPRHDHRRHPDPSTVERGLRRDLHRGAGGAGRGHPDRQRHRERRRRHCVGTVAAGTCNLTSTTTGAKTLTATYATDGNFAGSTSAGVAHTVNAAAPRRRSPRIRPIPASSASRMPVTFTVTGAPGTPTGNVTVSDGTGASCIGTVAAGTCNLTSTTAGAKTLTATYAGDATHTGSISAGMAHTVNAAGTTTTITADTPDPSVVGRPTR